MSNERFMRHHYGAAGYVPPNKTTKSSILTHCKIILSIGWKDFERDIEDRSQLFWAAKELAKIVMKESGND